MAFVQTIVETVLFTCLITCVLAGPVVKRHHSRHDKDKNRSLTIQKTLDMLIRDWVTEKPSLTCWTCPSMNENGECNDWAPDIPCSEDHKVCKSVHHIHIHSGQTRVVSKMCARENECTANMVGCHQSNIPGIMTCISCCTESYCNEAVPFDHESAISLSSSYYNAAPTARATHYQVFLIALLSVSGVFS